MLTSSFAWLCCLFHNKTLKVPEFKIRKIPCLSLYMILLEQHGGLIERLPKAKAYCLLIGRTEQGYGYCQNMNYSRNVG